MAGTGSLIKTHIHEHYLVLEKFNEIDGILFYNNSPLFMNIQLSENENNIITKEEDGLFVDGSFLNRFEFKDNELYFDDIIVSREYTDQQITDMIDELWVANSFHEIGILDLTPWLKQTYKSNNLLIYKNTYGKNIPIVINNPEQYTLKIIFKENTYDNLTDESLEYELEPNDEIEIWIMNQDNFDIDNIEVKCK